MILQLGMHFVCWKGLGICRNEIRYSILRLIFNFYVSKDLITEFNLIQNYFPGLLKVFV